MAKANWLNISQSSGTGNASIDVSLPPHTGRKERSSVLTFRAANLSDVQCSVNQEGKKAFIDIESEIAINESGEEVAIEGMSNSARLTFYLGDGNLSNISLPETYMVNSINEKNGNVISGDPGASAEYNFAIAITVPANDDTTVKTREVVVEDEMGNKGVCVLSLAAQKKPYTEVEYIESTGTQWIHTGIFPDDNTVKCEVKIAYSSTSTGQLMGSGVSGNTRFNFGIESGRFRFGFGGGWFDANSSVLTADTKPHVFVLDANTKTGSIDGVVQATTNTYTPTGKNVLMLFARGVSSSAEGSNRTRGKMYYAKIWDKGVLVRDLIPVLDENNVACMYDKVSNKFFYNQGSGSFLYGNILGEYTPIEYIESTGTQWINTGVNIDTSTDEVELVIQGLTTTVYKWFFGEHDDGARFGLGSGDGSNKRNVAYGKTTYKVNDAQIYNSKHTFVANKDGVFLDGVKITNYASFTSTSTIYLFNLNISSQSSYMSSARIWSYKQRRNGQELINLTPVLDNNGVACMYDNVSGGLFYNSGTGQFVAGDIV